jgi:hypothetical protein
VAIYLPPAAFDAEVAASHHSKCERIFGSRVDAERTPPIIGPATPGVATSCPVKNRPGVGVSALREGKRSISQQASDRPYENKDLACGILGGKVAGSDFAQVGKIQFGVRKTSGRFPIGGGVVAMNTFRAAELELRGGLSLGPQSPYARSRLSHVHWLRAQATSLAISIA